MKTLGDYDIVRELGRGRVAIVFLAKDNKERLHAIKVLYSFSEESKAIIDIKREAKIMGRLFHPCIVRVESYQYLKADTGVNYHCLIMEYVEGQDLASYLASHKPVSVKETLIISWQVCQALEHAHSLKIIHRDIKPQNILISKDNRIKVADFGLASAANSSIASLSHIVGTPYYISPEQANGEKGDERSDLYSVGVLLYQMLAGRVPFEANSELVVLDMHRNKQAQKLSDLRKDVPARLEALIYKALAKSPSDRFQSAQAMREAIEQISSQESIDLQSTLHQPVGVVVWDMFLHWPISRLKAVVDSLAANLLQASLVWVSALIFIIWLSFTNIVRNGDVTIANVSTPTQSSIGMLATTKLIPTFTATLTPALTNTPLPTATHIPDPTATHTPTATETPQPEARPNGSTSTRIRSDPSFNENIIGELAVGRWCRVTGKTEVGDWWKISCNDITGWVHNSAVETRTQRMSRWHKTYLLRPHRYRLQLHPYQYRQMGQRPQILQHQPIHLHQLLRVPQTYTGLIILIYQGRRMPALG